MTDRVLVTGATGFLGRALTRRLLDDGYTVAVVQRPQSPAADSRCTRIKWDGDAPKFVDDVEAWQPQEIYHLATHFVSQHGTQDLPNLIDANIALGTALLEGAQRAGSQVVLTGSAWQHYGGAPYDPVSLYAATKQALLDIAIFYRQMGVDVREISFFDTYGPGDDRGKLVSSLLGAAASGQTLDMSSGHQLIDLIYVSDAVDALIATTRTPEVKAFESGRFVARSRQPISIKELVEEVQRVVERQLSIRWGVRPDRPREMIQDWDFGQPVPSWTPSISLHQGLSECWSRQFERSSGGERG